MADTTDRLALPYILADQAQKHVTHNEALVRLDALVHLAVLDRDQSAPPASPTEGDRHIVAANPSGDWSGHASEIAAWQDGAWLFLTPQIGWRAWLAKEANLLVFDGNDWTPALLTPDMLSTGTLTRLGVNTAADDDNRLAAKTSAVLLSHDDVSGSGNGSVLGTFNKAATGNDAGLKFQTGSSTRALIGLYGDDDFHIKVSPDGSTDHDALTIDASDGGVSLAAGLSLAGGTDRLDAYQLGSWTPGFGASDTDPSSATFTASGNFARIGKYVFVNFGLNVTSKGTGGSGNATITNLPFSSDGHFYSSDLRHAGVAFPAPGAPMMRSSGTSLVLYSTAGADMLWSDLPSGTFSFLGCFSYLGV
ncbi:DUF2793 domain-containing protein [Jiella sp. MQZ9-1]|uniref:DUF2793 domain-containing protein n=1 Tax=Jiella flava TaxID=2816857 RepID=A0A939JWC2_9HYPH|nr:DUF2793 domain-containing protein [Jiella flava]MBO0663364.1 DUF2793 domain-containing protein [Jiella flava]MCD2471940.1 DUF2793 domain-containing protein [Jiella flava]